MKARWSQSLVLGEDVVKRPGEQQGALAQSKRQALCPAFLGLVMGPEWGSTLFPTQPGFHKEDRVSDCQN